MRAVDAYCERVDPGYWAEPVNAVTNAAFVLAALVMWRRSAGLVTARVLCGVLAMIGFGSYLFHTHAQVWAGVVDVLSILAFVLVYLFAVNREVFDLGGWSAAAVTGLFFPFAGLMVPVFSLVPGMSAAASYAPIALLILLYAVVLRRRLPVFSRGLTLGAGLLVISLIFRSLDLPVCDTWPSGTHFVWHLLNALMLGWMIEVYRRLRLGKRQLAR